MGPLRSSVQQFTPATSPAICKLGAPVQGVIHSLRILAIGASPASFTYAIYNSALAFVPTAGGALTAVLSDKSEFYRVTPDITITSNALPAGSGLGLNYPYENSDNTVSTRLGIVYLFVTGAGAGATLGVASTIETCVQF